MGRGGGKPGARGAHAGRKQTWQEWIDDYEAASECIFKHDVEATVIEAGGLARISSFLPEFVAEGILTVLKSIPDSKWNETAARGKLVGTPCWPLTPAAAIATDWMQLCVFRCHWGGTWPPLASNVLRAVWSLSAEDYRQNNISHSFSSVKQANGLDAVIRLFTLVRPEALHAFSAAK